MTSAIDTPITSPTEPAARLARLIQISIALLARIPDSLIAFVGRFSIAAVLLYLIAKGPGVLSVDHWIARRHAS